MSISSNTIVSPKPPLNLFESNRLQLQGNSWFTVLDVPKYIVPATTLEPQYTINAAAIMTGLTVSNLKDSGDTQVSVRILGTDNGEYYVVKKAPIPVNDFIYIGLDRQVILSGERLQISCTENSNTSTNNVAVHFSFILNQRESYIEVK